jgi:hypothetical protein
MVLSYRFNVTKTPGQFAPSLSFPHSFFCLSLAALLERLRMSWRLTTLAEEVCLEVAVLQTSFW